MNCILRLLSDILLLAMLMCLLSCASNQANEAMADEDKFDRSESDDRHDGDLEPDGDGELEKEAEEDWDGDWNEDNEYAEEDPALDLSPFHVAVITDTHLMLSNENENNIRFMEVGQTFNFLSPKVDLVVNTGDMVDDLFCFPDINCDDPLPVLANYRSLIEAYYDMPVYLVLGNHDMRYFDTFLDAATPLESWRYVFGDTNAYPSPYYAVKHKGFLFIVLNSTDLAYDHDSNDLPTFGKDQLAWLEEQLNAGLPAILFFHHYLLDNYDWGQWSTPPGEPDQDPSPLLSVIREYQDTVKAVFAGHVHHFEKGEWEGVMFYQTDNLGKNDYAPYHLVQCDPATGMVSIVNESEIEYAD